MLKEGMYVRCSIDREYPDEPRDFAAGKIMHIDSFNESADISFLDPFGYGEFYELTQSKINNVPLKSLTHNLIPENYVVELNGQKMSVQSCQQNDDGFFEYYLKNNETNHFEKHDEREITAPFTACGGDPIEQLKSYEFQNPCWFLGRQVVDKTMSVLNNSIYGLKELAGCRIYLKAYQIDTIMRCLASEPCRYIIADEVGLGKTIEAGSILKIYLSNHNHQNVLIITPAGLVTQWRNELFYKFDLSEGEYENHNKIKLVSVDSLNSYDLPRKLDFLIVDEVHNYLSDEYTYRYIHVLSRNIAKNVIFLSATPIQQRQEEYLKLLRLVLPDKYDAMTEEEFEKRLNIQKKILRTSNSIINDIDSYKEDIQEFRDDNEDLHNNDDLKDEEEEILDEFHDVAEIVQDKHFNEMIDEISIDSDDLGVQKMQLAISYICENYQVENHMIRSRRSLHKDDFSERRKEALPYDLNEETNFYESDAYRALTDWLRSNDLSDEQIGKWIQPILMSFFSSPWAYSNTLNNASKEIDTIPEEVIASSNRWVEDENINVQEIDDLLEDPDQHPDRLVKILDYVMNVIPIGKKAVLFTDYQETFDKYYSILKDELGDEVTGYGGSIPQGEREVNIYHFQNDPQCHYLLCDKTGGEGRNLQIADYVIHIDLPWDISELEQRIGRLDRLGRNVHEPVVSVIPYSTDTYEEQLFKLWDNGMKVFDESLSGLEIMMSDITEKIHKAIRENTDYGLEALIPDLISEAEQTRKEVKIEQIYDIAAKRFQPMYDKINSTLNKYQFNENSLFAQTMMSWAQLAGFGSIRSNSNPDLVRFSQHEFSPKSAERAFLIPPDWHEYLHKKQNAQIIKIQNGIEQENKTEIISNSILGTFDRNNAIKEDYLHFFAPGDEVFDSIVNNAEQSYRGTCCALAAVSKISWAGFIYVFSVKPDENYLLDQNVSLFSMGEFRMYLNSSRIIIPVGFSKYNNVDTKDVVREFKRITRLGYFNASDSIEHFGRRGRTNGGFLEIPSKFKCSNIEYFKRTFPSDTWENLIDQSRKIAERKAERHIKKNTDLDGIRELMEQKISSQISKAELFNEKYDAEEIRNQLKVIYTSIEHPEIKIKSACYMHLKREN